MDAACELALTLSQMRKFVVPKTSTEKVDAEQARKERAAVMAAKAGVANSLGLSWPPPLKKRVGRPSRRDLYVDSVYRHIDEHASVPADFTLDVPVWWVRGDMHPPTTIGDEAVDVFEPNEEDMMATGILDDSDVEASDAEAAPAPTAAESHVHEAADVEEPKLSKLAALRN